MERKVRLAAQLLEHLPDSVLFVQKEALTLGMGECDGGCGDADDAFRAHEMDLTFLADGRLDCGGHNPGVGVRIDGVDPDRTSEVRAGEDTINDDEER